VPCVDVDCVYSDEGVCFPIQKGLVASRSKIKFFRHNDVPHLTQLLEEQHRLDKKVRRVCRECMYVCDGVCDMLSLHLKWYT